MVFTDDSAALLASKKPSLWEVQPVLEARRVLHNITSNMFEDFFSYEMCSHIFLSTCWLVWRRPLYSMDPETLYPMSAAGPDGVRIPKFTVCNEKAKNGLIAYKELLGRKMWWGCNTDHWPT